VSVDRDKWTDVPDEVRATVEKWSREQEAACDARRCPQCRGDLTRTTDARQHGDSLAPGAWVQYRCAGCRWMVDRKESDA